jgi:Integrase core domain.
VVEESDSDDDVPRALVPSDKEMSSGTQSTYRDAMMKSPRVSPPVSDKIMPTKSVVIPYENSEVEQRVGVEAGTSLENGTISGKGRRLLTQHGAETRRNRLAGTTMDVNEAHRLFGHKSGATLQKIASALGVKLTGKFKPCSSCILVTARRSKVNRVSMVKSETPGERLCVDTTGPFPPAMSHEQYVVVVVNEATGYSWSHFSKTKREVAELVKSTINCVKQAGRTTVYLRCDNAGENVSYLSPVCRDKRITLERSPPDTPQQYNGKVERKIATLWQGTKKNLTAAGFSLEMRQRLWVESWKYTERLENLACNAVLWEGPRPLRIVDKPIEFDRTGVMYKGKATKKSMLNNGRRVIMVWL